MALAHETAGLMDDIYRHQRHIYDVTRKYYLLGRDVLIDRLQVSQGQSVLELGCGTGRNLIAAARKYPQARFYGVDISEAMLVTARENIEKAGLSAQISVCQGDASDPTVANSLPTSSFDRVFYSYTLSMMPIWKEALAVGAGLLSENGRISVVDFGQQERLGGLFRWALFKWLSSFHVTPRADLETELGGLARDWLLGMTFRPLYRGYAHYAELTKEELAPKGD